MEAMPFCSKSFKLQSSASRSDVKINLNHDYSFMEQAQPFPILQELGTWVAFQLYNYLIHLRP
jgi:hypothetical protein